MKPDKTRPRNPHAQIKSRLEAGQLDEARRLLRELLDTPDGRATLRQKETLIAPQNPDHREVLLDEYRKWLLGAPLESSLKNREMAYLSYCRQVALERDRIGGEVDALMKVLVPFDLADIAELCACAVVDLAIGYMQSIRRGPPGMDPHGHNITAAAFELSGIYQLLVYMLRSVKPPERPSTSASLVDLLRIRRAASALLLHAEDWQALSFRRHKIAFGFSVVTRADNEGRIFIEPWSREEEIRRRIADRRLVLQGLLYRSNGERIKSYFGGVVARVAEVALRICPESSVLQPQLEPLLLEYIERQLTDVDWMLLGSAPDGDDGYRMILAMWCAYLLVIAIQMAKHPSLPLTRGPCRRRTAMVAFDREEIVDLVRRSVSLDPENISRIVDGLIVRVPDIRQDFSRQPFVDLGSGRVGCFLFPGTAPALFDETRRILAEGDRTSRYIGKAYEEHIRALLRDAGVQVVSSSIKVRDPLTGDVLTDVDILGHKDGVVFLVQAKFMTEPDSHHARWKGRFEIDKGIFQCSLALDHFAVNRDRLSDALGVKVEAPDFVAFVVSPTMFWSGDIVGAVAVLDHYYLETAIRVGARRVLGLDGKTVSSQPLFAGDKPTGQELAQIIRSPLFLEQGQVKMGDSMSVHEIGELAFVEFRPDL